MTVRARLWWVRHGPTHLKTMCGWTDAPADLSDAMAVEAMRTELPPNVSVISSDLLRARQTAAAITGAEPETLVPDLRELHFGNWEGRSAGDVSVEEPDLARRFWSGEEALRAPGGESWRDLVTRVDRAEAEILRTGGDVVVVAHMGVIMTRLQAALGLTAHEAMAFQIDPLSVTRIDHLEDGSRVVPALPPRVG